MGHSANPSNSLGSDGLTLERENPTTGAKKPLAPMAPPRVPLLLEESRRPPSLGYRPPPPKLRREAESLGNCSFDSSKWSVQPQSAISGAIMFDRETGLSCDECLEKCSSEKYQNPKKSWVCRSLTYDNKYKICDLFAVNGTEYPYYLVEYETRDYFDFLAALPPTDAELNGEEGGEGAAAAADGQAGPEGAAAGGQAEGAAAGGPAEGAAAGGQAESAAAGGQAQPEIAAAGGQAEKPGAIPQDNSQVAGNSVGGAEAPNAETPASGAVTSHEGGYGNEGLKAKAFAAPKSVSIINVGEPEIEQSKNLTEIEVQDLLTTQESSTSETTTTASTETATEVKKTEIDEQFARRNSINNACGDDEVTRYLEFVDLERTEALTDTEYTDASNRKQCIDYCDDEGVISCASAMFSTMGCELSLSRANYTTSDSLKEAPNVTYVEKVCVPKNIAQGTKKVFGSVLNHILVGQVLEVTDAKSIKECVISCLKAEQQFGFVCRSAMWYPNDDDQNCLLNTESRITTPEVFMPEDQGVNVVYFEIPKAVDESIKEKAVNVRFRDSPISTKKIETKWTRWSMCKKDDMNAQRHRYLKCTDKKDIRKCPKESVMCRHPPMLNIKKLASAFTEKIECLAIRDSNGQKRCPHGMRIRPDGKREYCGNPIDC
uniref:Apple domain-containing protein n=1 Tax=Acrobeloides nanus TaxID=290746 RepID=A0A914EN27_9BILA